MLHRKTSVKYLGVLLDESLNWTSHVKYLQSKLSFASSTIYKIPNFVPINALRIIYYCFIYSHLQYCIISYGTACDSVLQLLNTTIMFCTLSYLVILNVTQLLYINNWFFLNKRYISIRAI